MQTDWYADLVVSQLIKSFEYYLQHIRRLPRKAYISLRYEDLCRDSRASLASIGDWLKRDLTPHIPDNFIAPRQLPLLKRAQRAYQQRIEDFEPYLLHSHYPKFQEDNNEFQHEC